MNKIGMSVDGGKDIYSTDFAEYFPDALKKDKNLRAIAGVLAKGLLSVSNEAEKALVYARIDELPEEIVDILAYDMHADWYDYSYMPQVKRSILKNSVKTHKSTGTKRAVEELVREVFGEGAVKEWFEYGDDPYYFKIETTAGLRDNINEFFSAMIHNVKNARSHLRSVDVKRKIEPNLFAGIGVRAWVKNPPIRDAGIPGDAMADL